MTCSLHALASPRADIGVDGTTRGSRHRRRTTGGPTAVGPARRRYPRGTCSPPVWPRSSSSRALLDAGIPNGSGRLRASPGAPPPVSLAIGPLVARVTSSAPRSSQHDLRRLLEHLDPTSPGIVLVRTSTDLSFETAHRPTHPPTFLSFETAHPLTPRTHEHAQTARSDGTARRPGHSGAPTMPPGRREGRRRGTQAEGPRGSRAAALNRFGRPYRSEPAMQTNEATQAASTCHGDTAVVRDPQPSALPSSADTTTSPALLNQRPYTASLGRKMSSQHEQGTKP